MADPDLIAIIADEGVVIGETTDIVVLSVGEQGPQGAGGGGGGGGGGGDVAPRPFPVVTSEQVNAGEWVHIWNDGGVAKVRKAGALPPVRRADGFVVNTFLIGTTAMVYSTGAINDATNGQTPGKVFLSETPGMSTSTPPTGVGKLSQKLGTAFSTVAIMCVLEPGIILAT